jgi:hypothetical protein
LKGYGNFSLIKDALGEFKMERKKIFYLWVIFTITLILPYTMYAQEKGRIGLTVKAQLIPHAGISYGISDNIQTRLSTYLDFSDSDLTSSIMSSLCILLKVSSDKSLSTYIGPDITYDGFIDKLFLGIILGTKYDIYKKINIYGEFGPSLKIGDGIEGVNFLNTGIGITYFLN